MAESRFGSITGGILHVLNEEFPVLQSLSEEVISKRRNSQNRTIKQILGHLIDSASNNHQRMVRLQYTENLIFPDYRQNNDLWIELQDYQHADWNNLVDLWKSFNLHIIQVINSVNTDKLGNSWHDFEGTRVTLEDMITGYLDHLHLHISEIHELIGE